MKTERSVSRREKKRSACLRRLRCNLCRKVFRPSCTQDRFCRACKSEDELFRFHEWLPAGQ